MKNLQEISKHALQHANATRDATGKKPGRKYVSVIQQTGIPNQTCHFTEYECYEVINLYDVFDVNVKLSCQLYTTTCRF